MHFSKSKQIPGKYPKCRLLWGGVGGGGGGGSKGGSENEKGDTSRYLLLAGYPVTEREKKEQRKDYNRPLWWYEAYACRCILA